MRRIRSWGVFALSVLASASVACGSSVNPGAEDPGTDAGSDTSVVSDTSSADDSHVGGDSSPSETSTSDSSTTTDSGTSGDGSTSCDPPKKTCGDRCVDVQSDDANCGDCGTKCDPGQVCTLGICKCPDTNVLCGTACIDLSSDPAHCGGCDKACASGATCVSGKCSACPTSKPTICGDAPGVCTDTQTDASNCGGCGTKCTSGATCSGGACVCPKGLVDCGTGCVDLSKDTSNCGGCGISCGSGGSCGSGSCSCAAGAIKCGGSCIDPSSDASNCGGCGVVCGAGGKCLSGHCSVPKCKAVAPSVLFYGPTAGTTSAPEQAYLPTGATVTIAAETTWRSMTTADFQKYDLVVIGEPSSGGGGPAATDLQAAFDTRDTWGAAINGRVAVLGMDPAFHAGMSTTGANTLLKATLAWLSGGAPKTTSLYVSPDWGTRGLDYMSHFGAFASTADVYINSVTILDPTHPILVGSTDTTLSSWSSSAHDKITSYPSGFTPIANGWDDLSGTTDTPGPVIVVKDGPACAP